MPSRYLRTCTLAAGLLAGLLSLAPASRAATFQRGQNLSHWLSQNNEHLPYAAPWFTEEDVAWIAAQGFDHIRITVDGRVWLKPDGSLDESKIVPFEKLLGWVKKHQLGGILDMHFLPGADFNDASRDTRVFTDPVIQKKVADFWRQVAKRYAGEGDYLRFEILNEPVAEQNQQLNPFQLAMLAAIRESNPTRVVYLTSNRWSSIHTVEDVVVPADPNVAITVHFYEPFVFTHQKAPWAGSPPDLPVVPFPGVVPDLTKLVSSSQAFYASSGKTLSVAADIDAPFAEVAAWAAKHAPGKEIYLGEFGVYEKVPDAFRSAWIVAVRKACERHHFSWAIWDYKGGFATRGRDGQPTAILKALQEK